MKHINNFVYAAGEAAARHPRVATFVGASLVIGSSFAVYHGFDRHGLSWRDVAEQAMAVVGAAAGITLFADAGGCYRPASVQQKNHAERFER